MFYNNMPKLSMVNQSPLVHSILRDVQEVLAKIPNQAKKLFQEMSNEGKNPTTLLYISK